MEQKTDSLYPSVQLEKNDWEQWLEKRLNDVYIANNSINNFKKMITYSKEKQSNGKRRYKKKQNVN